MNEIKKIFGPQIEGHTITRLCEMDEFMKNILKFFSSPQFEVAANTQSKEYIQGAMWGISMATTVASLSTPTYLTIKEDQYE